MPPTDPALPVLFGRAEAAAAGIGPDRVVRRLRSRSWTRIRRGYYSSDPELPESVRWRAEIAAHLRASGRPLVLSHAHAARAWGLPLPQGGWGTPSFTDTGGSPRSGATVVKVAPLTDADVVRMLPVPVTSLARTVVDCARSLPDRDGLAMADAALRSRLVHRHDLEAAMARQRGWPGARRAYTVLALADGRREGPFESWSAWSFARHGVPQPAWQVEVCDERGAFVARVDTLWAEGVAGEADGRATYRLAANRRGGADVETLAAVLDEERLREMALRRLGLSVVRWDARDVLVPAREAALAEHLTREVARAEGQVFRGRVHRP